MYNVASLVQCMIYLEHVTRYNVTSLVQCIIYLEHVTLRLYDTGQLRDMREVVAFDAFDEQFTE